MAEQSITIDFISYESVAELSEEEQACFKLADEALANAYAPYSNFKVAAVVLFDDRTHFCGTNQENGAYPSGLCAERVAIFGAKSNHPDKVIESMFLVTKEGGSDPFTPCGACRQSMVEYEQLQNEGINVFMKSGNSTIYKFSSVADLLPLAFNGQEALKKH